MVFVLLGIEATLGNACGIWEHLHSFREVKRLTVVVVKVTTYTKYIFIYIKFQKVSKMTQAEDTVNSAVGWADNGKYKQIL